MSIMISYMIRYEERLYDCKTIINSYKYAIKYQSMSRLDNFIYNFTTRLDKHISFMFCIHGSES